ncbi:MAG: EamA family transporter [Alphaproteobacteria bacterium]|nr:EamA family transporter [Alphaproteobacteria bacterium]
MPLGTILLALAVTSLWGFSFVVISYAFEAFPPILLSFFRVTAASLPILVLIRPPRIPLGHFIALSLLLAVVQQICMFVGIDLGVPGGIASVLVQSQVFFTTALAYVVLKERPVAIQYIGIAVAAGGMAVIAISLPSGGSLLGFIAVLGCAASWGVSNIIFKLIKTVDLIRLLAWCHLPAVPINFALSYAMEGGPLVIDRLISADATHYLAAIFLGLISSTIGYLIWSTLMRRHSATLIAPFSLLIPIFGMTFMAVLRGEEFGTLRLIGALGVMAGLALCVFRLRRVARAPASELTLPEAVTMVRPIQPER